MKFKNLKMPVAFCSETVAASWRSLCEISNFCFLNFVATLPGKKIAFCHFLGEKMVRVNNGTFSF